MHKQSLQSLPLGHGGGQDEQHAASLSTDECRVVSAFEAVTKRATFQTLRVLHAYYPGVFLGFIDEDLWRKTYFDEITP